MNKLLLTFCLLIASSTGTFAQTLLVDGSVTPTQIPDATAYQAVLLYMQDTTTVTSLTQKVNRIGFSNAADIAAFETAVATFSKAYDSGEQSFTSTTTTFDDTIGVTLTQNCMITLQANLTSAGYAQLYAYIQQEKYGMKIYE